MSVVGLPKVVEDVSKLQSDVAVVATLVDRLEDSVNRFDRQTEMLHARISSGEREIKQKIDEQYDELMKEIKDLLPQRYGVQKEYSDRLDKRFRVAEDTVFTTITINKKNKLLWQETKLTT